MACWTAVLVLGAGILCADQTCSADLSTEVLDLSLVPPPINTAPGTAYSTSARSFAMSRGVERTAKGRLYAAWVGGGDNDLAFIMVARSDDQGGAWSNIRLVVDPEDPPGGLKRRSRVGNLWTDPLGRLWLFFDQTMGNYDGRAGLWSTVCNDPDAEHPHWSAPKRHWHGGALNKPIVLKSGEWMLPVSLWSRQKISPDALRNEHKHLDPFRMAHVLVSRDQGETWGRRGGVRFPQSQFDENVVVQLNDDRLWMLARTSDGIAQSFSQDGGFNWTKPEPSGIAHTSSRFAMRRLASGRLLLVKHGATGERTPSRSRLMAFLSEDDGATWAGGLMIDRRPGVSYPDAAEAPDGTIFVVYDRNRSTDAEILLARLTEADVLAGSFHSVQSAERLVVTQALPSE